MPSPSCAPAQAKPAPPSEAACTAKSRPHWSLRQAYGSCLHRLDRVVGAVPLPALMRDADGVVVELEAVAGRIAGRVLAACKPGRRAEREPLAEELVHDLVPEREVRD